MATHVCRKKVGAARQAEHEQAEHEQAELAAPEVHSAEALSDLKLKRDAKRHRKMTRKGSEWRTKDAIKDPEVRWHWVFRSHQEEVRNIRPHMTMHVKGGWQLKLEDGGAGEEEQTGWVAAFEEKPVIKEVALSELLKTAKRQKTRRKDGEFEIVRGGSHSVMVLDDETAPEVVDEPWEFIESDDEESAPAMSYAEVAANAGA